MKRIYLVILSGSLVLAACASPKTVIPATAPATLLPTSDATATPLIPTATPENPLGTLTLEQNQVFHGQAESALLPLLESAFFFEQDIIQVIEGGEAILDFGDQIRLRLFNDTELQTVSAEVAEDAPLAVQIFLFTGGFTGQLTEQGGRAVFRTPGNVEINVLGTEYFITYDPQTEETTVGNFGGTVEVTSAGSQLSLDDAFYVVVPAGSPPGPQSPLPLSREEFETYARRASSPVQAASRAKVWSLEIRHEFSLDVEGSTSTHLRLWSGHFTLEGDTLAGSGTGVIENVNITCPNIDRTKFDITGSFDFDIRGQLITGEDGRPAFILEIAAKNLEMNTIGSCDGFSEAVQDLNRDIVEDLPLRDVEAINVQASDGTQATFALDGAPYDSEESIYFRYPIEVTVFAGQE